MDNIWYDKYLYYKKKYLTLKSSSNQTGGANNNKYSCDPNKEFANICMKDNKGMYYNMKKCMDRCEPKYIIRNLIQTKLAYETTTFNQFVQDLIKENIDVYIKGGTVLGLKVLQMVYNTYPDKDFEKVFNEFMKLKLIQDWDFSCYTDKTITPEYRKELDTIAAKHKLVERAKTFILYQTKRPVMLDDIGKIKNGNSKTNKRVINKDQALFELSILGTDGQIGAELPLTTMKVKVTHSNLLKIFMLAKTFASSEKMDMNVIKYYIKDMDFIIDDNINGLYDVKKVDFGTHSPDMIKFIKEYSKELSLQQFFATQLIEPNRMLYRLLEKNIPKINKIRTFFDENKINYKRESWLFDPIILTVTVEKFIKELGSYLYKTWAEKKDINSVIKVVEGINLDRIKIEYLNIGCKGKEFIKTLFQRIYIEGFKASKDKMPLDNKFTKMLLFLEQEKLFTSE